MPPGEVRICVEAIFFEPPGRPHGAPAEASPEVRQISAMVDRLQPGLLLAQNGPYSSFRQQKPEILSFCGGSEPNLPSRLERRSRDFLATQIDPLDFACVRNVVQGIGVEHNEVRLLALGNRPKPIESQHLGGVACPRKDSFHRSESALGHQHFQLDMRAESEILSAVHASGVSAHDQTRSRRLQPADVANKRFALLWRFGIAPLREDFPKQPNFLRRKRFAQDRLIHPGGLRIVER